MTRIRRKRETAVYLWRNMKPSALLAVLAPLRGAAGPEPKRPESSRRGGRAAEMPAEAVPEEVPLRRDDR